MHYDGDKETGEPDSSREDERHELDVAAAVEAAYLEFGELWLKRIVQRVKAEQAQETPALAQAEDVDESACPI